jgi:drug/metabolite transporter (DMT)-like permease
MWEMILGPIWVLLFLGEAPSPIVWAGFAVIIAGMLLDARVHARDDAQAAAVL